jgi:CheY-like chemotaxis protein
MATNPRGKQAKDASGTGRPNTVNLEQSALEALLDELDAGSEGADSSKRRGYVRWPFRKASIRVSLVQGDNMETELSMACRNLSRGGASLLHRSFLHTGSRVRLFLPDPRKGEQMVVGTVCRCRHVRGVVHEIGVRFAQEIDARSFLPAEGLANHFSLERVDPDALQGTIVHVDDSPMDRRLVQHFLRGSQIRLRQTDDGEEALRFIAEGCDLALIDLDLGCGKPSGFNLIGRLRGARTPTPLVMLTSDVSADTKVPDEISKPDAYLLKPVTQDVLLRAIAEFLLVSTSAGPIFTSLNTDHPNFSLVDGYVDQLRGDSLLLRRALEESDGSRIRSVCLQVMGTAPTMGYESIAKGAEAVIEKLARNQSVVEVRPLVLTLITACERARPINAAA